jgi:RNA polymerase sigma-70 factor (ECF subfamily)
VKPVEPARLADARLAHARLAHLADEQLAERAAGGDRTALDVLLRRHQRLVYRLCRRLCAGEADALDATQEALVTVARRIDHFDGRSSFTTWLYRVTTNACLDELRRRRRRPWPMDLDTPVGVEGRRGFPAAMAHGAAADPAETAAQRIDLDRALASLAPAARAVVVLRDVIGLDYAEIAAVLDVPGGTVKSRLARARAQLAATLEADSRPEEGNRLGRGRRPSSHDADAASSPTVDIPTPSPAPPGPPPGSPGMPRP